MVLSGSKSKLVFLFLTSILMISSGLTASNWSIYDENTLSRDVVSFDTPTVQIVNITANTTDTTLTPDDSVAYPVQLIPEYLGNEFNISYKYNKTNGTYKELRHLENGLWYTEFTPTNSQGNEVFFRANGSTSREGVQDSGNATNLTLTPTVGDFEVSLEKDYNLEYKAGKEFELTASLTNNSNTVDNSSANVKVYFENYQNKTRNYLINNYDDSEGEFYNSRVKFPDTPNTTYIMHVIAEDDNGSVEGTNSRIVNIAPQVKGEIAEFTSSGGCETQNLVDRCEQSADINLEYDITASEAENVNLSVYAFNSSERKMISSKNLSGGPSQFDDSITVPDLNTSKYKAEMEFVFNATNRDREHVDRHNVTLEGFKIQHTPSTTYLGNEYTLEVFLGKPYSSVGYSKQRFKNITINISNPSGESVNLLNKEDLDYSSNQEIMRKTFLIEESMETGTYTLDISAENIYGWKKSIESSFSVRNADATFETESDLDYSFEHLESRDFNVPIENLIEDQNSLSFETSGFDDEDSFVILNNSLTLQPEESTSFGVRVNLTSAEDMNGEILITDDNTNYNYTVDVNVEAPDCQIVVGELCVKDPDEISVTAGSTEEFFETVELKYIGPEGGSLEYNTSVEGDVGPFVSLRNESNVTLEDERNVLVSFQAGPEGTYGGQILFETDAGDILGLPVTLVSNVDGNVEIPEDDTENDNSETNTSDISLSANPSSVDLGYMEDGSRASEQITLTNSGENDSDELAVNSPDFSVSVEDDSPLTAGEERDLTMQFESVEEESGEVTIQAGDSVTISVTANPVENKASDLRRRKSTIQSRADNINVESRLTQSSVSISDYETAYGNGNYEEAQQMYSRINSELNSISNEVGRAQGPGGTNSDNNSSGGLPILPILVGGILFALIVGFVVFTSYIPEKGDPLYSVLGE